MVTIDGVAQAVPSRDIGPNRGALTTADYLRVASMAIAAYDYLLTIPSEFRLYKTTSPRSLGFVLFVLIRYISMVLIIISNAGFFYHHFSLQTCVHYAYVTPAFKVLQIMVSDAIQGVRTYNIARRNYRLGWFLILMYIAVVVSEWFVVFYGRSPKVKRVGTGTCLIKPPHRGQLAPSWTFYLAAMLFDLLTLSISTHYLLKAKVNTTSAVSKLVNVLLYDGLGYFVALTAVNLMNSVLYRPSSHAFRSTGVSLGYALTWIMSQRILIHTHEAREQQTSVVAAAPQTWNTSTSAWHSDEQREHETPNKDLNSKADPPDRSHNSQGRVDITVHVDNSITRDVRPPSASEDQDLRATTLSVFGQSRSQVSQV